jgi:hypothetical protein
VAKVNVRTIPFDTYAAGTYQLPSVNAGQASTEFELGITRTSLPDTSENVMSILLEGSDDNGATWQQLVSGTLAGGEVIDRQGNVATESTFGARYDNSKPGNYRLRGSVTLLQDLTTGARLTVY